ncbi:hypothetical protein COCMIDRAFT_82990 [Bipolaris oryzae ATCC 44560]|uniref:Uncharacterized protein n=1 Tax=Bipolaris oryzae ATCC 44560 TaxID=930090 RepID=W6ZR91_COCMI|nr:uncharacterized protein COCMIDRAFT_82990 [Bipolaris oryzae ATCC 44560]EUC50019.1 hypothetical protein COCMIDRAFT_82990 [Bipolaris oryzae ATCC 44560]
MSGRTSSKSKAEAPCKPQPLSDRVIAILHTFAKEERKRNFSFLGKYSHCYKNAKSLLEVELASPYDIAAIKKKDDDFENAGWYTFAESIYYPRRTVAISILDEEDVRIETMAIGTGASNMRDAASWIRDTYCTDLQETWHKKFSATQYDEQRIWWTNTGKHFKFLQLPLELREEIYRHVIEPVVVPDIVTEGTGRFIFGVGQSFGPTSVAERNRDPEIPSPNSNIFYVNKKVCMEFSAVACRETIKRFTTLRSGLGRGPKHFMPKIWRHALSLPAELALRTGFLRHIQLEMDAREYFACIGIYANSRHVIRTCAPHGMKFAELALLHGLQTLDLRFISPKHRLARCPWAMASPRRSPHSCQKKWIEYWIVLAWDMLRHLRTAKGVRISLSGCVKTSTVDFWQPMLNAVGDGDADAAMVASLRQEMREAILLQIQRGEMVFPCRCTYPCVGTSADLPVDFKDDEDPRLESVQGWQDILDKAYWDFDD